MTTEKQEPVSQEAADAIRALLQEKGVKYDCKMNEETNYDAATGRYLPGKKTFVIHLKLGDAATGQYSMRRVSSVADVEAALAEAKKELRGASKRTSRAIAAERRAS